MFLLSEMVESIFNVATFGFCGSTSTSLETVAVRRTENPKCGIMVSNLKHYRSAEIELSPQRHSEQSGSLERIGYFPDHVFCGVDLNEKNQYVIDAMFR